MVGWFFLFNLAEILNVIIMVKDIVILRGLPGSGKTTFGNLFDSGVVCSADDWHTRDGKYLWEPENIKKAHMWCQRKCERLMRIGVRKIIIANTNITSNEMAPYEKMAEKHNYRIFHIIIENRHGNKNIHNVPEETINNMKRKFNISL